MFKKTILTLGTLSLCLSMSGCVGGAVVAGGTAASTLIYDERPISVMLEDQNIEHLAAEAIKQSPQLKKTNISASALNHRVLVTGEVQTAAQRTIAYRLIRHVPKVKRVYNQLNVSRNLSAIDTGQDTWLTSKVRLALFNTKQLRSAQVRVITENKTVYLMGIITDKQRKLATNAARKVSGVRKVITLFEHSSS